MAITDADPLPDVGSDTGAASLLAGVRSVLATAQSIRLTDYEECQGDALRPLVASVRAAIDDAAEVLMQAVCRYDEPSNSSLYVPLNGNLCHELDRRMVDPASAAKIAGLAFVARFALQGHAASLGAFNFEGEPWEVISACGGAVREVLKSLSALELAVCEVEHLPPGANFYLTEVERSLRVRRAYACFRAEVLGAGPPDPSTLQRRLRMAASAIAKLVGREIYPSARVHDRWMIRQFQARIREWLQLYAEQREGAEALTVSGVRLWDELANIAELVMQVNHRAELRAHDGAALDAAIQKADADGLGPDDIAGLARLWGLGPQLDAMLDARRPHDDPAWVGVLRHTRDRLGRAPQASPSAEPRAHVSRFPQETAARTSLPSVEYF